MCDRDSQRTEFLIFIRQKVIIHTPPERGFINKDKSATHSQEQTPVIILMTSQNGDPDRNLM